jgi:urease accessory protein
MRAAVTSIMQRAATSNIPMAVSNTITCTTNIAIMSTAMIMPTVIPMLMTTNTERGAGMSPGAQDSATLFRLMTWLSPSFPVGSFSYSSGIEWAVEAGDITDKTTLEEWLTAMIIDGAGFCDGVFLCHAFRAAASSNGDELKEVAELAAAFTPSRERYLETTSQGRAFVEIARSAWSCDALDLLPIRHAMPVAYPVAVGVLAAGHRVPLRPTLHAFLHAMTSNWISAGVRLVPLGQTDSQHVLAALEPAIVMTADKSAAATLDDLGSATFRADLSGMRHEAQYTRLFRS